LTCEHGGHRVPARYAELFRGARGVLRTHRGYDIGALELARGLSRKLHAPLVAATTTRLLVDLNRSADSPSVFSEWTRGLDGATRMVLLRRFHAPHRERVNREVSQALRGGGRVIHVAVHSFTPVLDGRARRADIGLLFDPRRPAEAAFCGRLRHELLVQAPELRVLFNSPYRGWTDGLATSLRRELARSRYLGIELEVNQRFALDPTHEWKRVRAAIEGALASVVAEIEFSADNALSGRRAHS
jgi:predicted N-formylglutamate amidohydrolase